jgi:hypothetical protein
MKEVCSPANSAHPGPSKLGGGHPILPGAKSNPSRADRVTRDSVPANRRSSEEPATGPDRRT